MSTSTPANQAIDQVDHTNIADGSSTDRPSTTPAIATNPVLGSTTPSSGMGYNYYRPLHKAALTGDWESARKFLEEDPSAMTANISTFPGTALNIAALRGHSEFVEKLVELMPREALEIADADMNTALHYGALNGNIRIVKALVQKNSTLTQVNNNHGMTPLLCSAVVAHGEQSQQRQVIWYLSLVSSDELPGRPFTGPRATTLIFMVTYLGFYDIALHLIRRFPSLTTVENQIGQTPLIALAMRPSGFRSGSRLGFWESCIYPFIPVQVDHNIPTSVRNELPNGVNIVELPNGVNIVELPTLIQSKTYLAQVNHVLSGLLWSVAKHLVPTVQRVQQAKLNHTYAVELVKHICTQASGMNFLELLQTFRFDIVILAAGTLGIVEIIRICLEYFPDIIWFSHLAHTCIQFRQEKVFNLMQETNASNTFLLERTPQLPGNELLHLAAKLAPSTRLLTVPGSALQMQRELQWFKEVEKAVHPYQKEARNADGKTPWQIFTEEHRELMEKGEKWMKDTAQSGMVISTLVATVMFAAAFAIPGGNNNQGIPNHLHDKSFMVFVTSDALALFSSLSSLLMFISIQTSRYSEEDFLKSLPKRLIIGLASLFVAMATVMIAFAAALPIILGERFKWVSIPAILLASLPVIMFGLLHLPMFIQMVQSTYGSGVFRPENVW